MKYGKISGPVYARKDDRGSFSELVNYGEWQSLVVGKMRAGSEMGNHYHKHTSVFFYLQDGRARIKILNMRSKKKNEIIINPGEGYVFRPEEVRVIKYLEESGFILMKTHLYNTDDPDIIHYAGVI